MGAGSRHWTCSAGLFVAVAAFQLLAASWWLTRFSRGPLEQAWHWAYLAPQRSATPAR
ncbi:DUF418 domain-containing protein [Prauserella cavernicola]|uniref:DUF418 domain-containing protein n=1 Tax=Prauserella cavernicola TaxID=2800127 RepID=A0A934QTE0_9PSEU|nr:DUF418 domain-containing protein [Prauserella cavernicola]MBK1785048.1 DUF418 domain-containing protein [Prauserella cavernicola]